MRKNNLFTLLGSTISLSVILYCGLMQSSFACDPHVKAPKLDGKINKSVPFVNKKGLPDIFPNLCCIAEEKILDEVLATGDFLMPEEPLSSSGFVPIFDDGINKNGCNYVENTTVYGGNTFQDPSGYYDGYIGYEGEYSYNVDEAVETYPEEIISELAIKLGKSYEETLKLVSVKCEKKVFNDYGSCIDNPKTPEIEGNDCEPVDGWILSCYIKINCQKTSWTNSTNKTIGKSKQAGSNSARR